MKRKYFVHYYRNFGNTFNLYYADTPDQLTAIPEAAQEISYKEAKQLAHDERLARKHDPAFSGYGDVAIYPADYPHDQCDIRNDPRYRLVIYTYERIR